VDRPTLADAARAANHALTVAQAAARAGCSATMVQRAVQHGELPATWLGRMLFFEPTHIDQWVGDRRARWAGERA
jgi:excisionase family DNA binding protein